MNQQASLLVWFSIILLLGAYPTLIAARESGERAGTEDINIGVGELQSEQSDDGTNSVTFGDGARGQRPGNRLNAPGATQTDSVVDELDGIVVLCADGSGDQNACVPNENTGTEGEDGAARRVPQTLQHRDR
jgi:hypothetical protein